MSECIIEKMVLNRLKYISNLYLKRPSMFQFINLMRSKNSKDIRNLRINDIGLTNEKLK